MLTSYIYPTIEINRAYILNNIPTIQKQDIYLIDSIEIENTESYKNMIAELKEA